jgi:hypothetical protein
MEQGAIDCHVHVFDPQRHSLHPETGYLPTGQEIGTPGRLAAVLAAHGMAGALLVGPNATPLGRAPRHRRTSGRCTGTALALPVCSTVWTPALRRCAAFLCPIPPLNTIRVAGAV